MMKKKILLMLMAVTMIGVCFVGGCGSKEEPIEETVVTEEVVEETTEDSVEVEVTVEEEKETTLGYIIEPMPEKEEVVEEVVEVESEEFTAEKGFEKVLKLFDARQELLDHEDINSDLNFLYAVETLTRGISICEISTSDGFSLDNFDDFKSSYIKYAIVSNYFYDYVNNDSGYYNLGEYASSNTSEDILNKYWGGIPADDADVEDLIMCETSSVIPYLLENMENLKIGELVVGDECTSNPVSGIEVYYEIPLLINDENSGVIAVFDKDCNFLNFITNEDKGWSNDNYRDSANDIAYLVE